MLIRCASGVLGVMLAWMPAGVGAQAPAATAQTILAAQIAGVAQRVARAQISDPDRALVPAYAVVDQIVPAGSAAIVPGTPQVNSDFVGVPVRIEVDGRTVRTLYTGFRVTTFVAQPVAAHDLIAGSVIGVGDVVDERLPFTGRAGASIESFAGRKVRSTVLRGDVLSLDVTDVNLIVHAGMAAVFIVRDGPVALAADVIARSSGGLGESVTIFNPQTQRTLTGIVTAPNTVELTLPGANE